MNTTTFIQIFILVDVLIIGLLAPIMIRHGRAHVKSKNAAPTAAPTPQPRLSDDAQARLLKASEARFEATVNQSIVQLQHNLDHTTDDINNLIKKLAVSVVSTEVENYRSGLAKLHDQAEKELGSIKQAVDSHQAEFQAKMAQEMELEKQRLIKQIDTKLGDAVGSFLLETLGHNVDLGAQSPYLMSLLEEHKADFAKEVKDDAK